MTERAVDSPIPWVPGLDAEGKRMRLPPAPPLWARRKIDGTESTYETATAEQLRAEASASGIVVVGDPSTYAAEVGWRPVVDAEGRSR